MREILFRGKRVDNGEWVEGGYIPLDVESGYTYIVEPYNYASTLPALEVIKNNAILVLPETVGLFTGLTDKNGKKIFNGDIVKHYHDKKSPESYSVGVIFYDEDHFRWKIIIENGIYCIGKDCVYEITGNIYDNPELIKEDEWI